MNLMKKMLAVPAAVLALWAVTAQATTDEAIAERLKPVGEVCIMGEECKGVETVAASAGVVHAPLTTSSPSIAVPATPPVCWTRRRSVTPLPGKIAPITRAASTASSLLPSPVSTPCRRKAPVLTARMTNCAKRFRRCLACKAYRFHEETALWAVSSFWLPACLMGCSGVQCQSRKRTWPFSSAATRASDSTR